jgi:pimeloyl-ACP methyl ester carboxylesterase
MITLQQDGYSFLANRWPLDPDEQTLLLIHGSGQSALFWQYQVQDPTDEANILAVDLPGHGRSREPGRQSVPDYAAWTMAFIEQLKLTHVVPAGLSLGGAVVQQLLIQFTGTFDAAVLLNTGVRLRVSQAIFETLDAGEDIWLEACYASGVFADNRTPELRRIVDAVSRCSVDVTRGDFLACHQFDVMDHIETINIPVLVLMADQDQLTPLKYGRFLAERLPNAHPVMITDAGHFSPLEKPEAVNQAIREFLHRHER